MNLKDGMGRSVTNGQFRTIPGGIHFRKGGFVGNRAFDWADVQTLFYRQRWSLTSTAPLAYWATEFRAVP